MGGQIPRSFIDDLLARVDIVDVIDSRVPLKKAGKEYKACCPFHQEKTPSFTVSQSKQFYHCFGCGAHGSAIGFLMEYERLSFPEAVHELARELGLEVPQSAAPALARPTVDKDLFDLLERVARWYRQQLKQHPQRERAVAYLKQRGLSGEIAARYELGYAPPGWNNLERHFDPRGLLATGMLIESEHQSRYDRFRDRIMFPIRNRRGQVIGFGGRVLGDEQPKYLNSPETELFHKGRELYGLYQARQAARERGILVVEGYMDVISLAQHGLEHAVATLGTAITGDHLRELIRHTPRITFCFDGDRAGREAAWRALETVLPLLQDGLELRFLFLPQGEDPDSMMRRVGLAGFERLLDEAQPLSAFLIDRLSSQADLRTLDGQARLTRLAAPLLRQMPAGSLRELIVQRLAERIQLDPRSLARQLGVGGAAGAPRSRARGAAPGQRKPSAVRTAIALLLAHPELAQTAGAADRFAGLELPGIQLLQELLELLQQNPNLTTGAILEHWREREEGRYLGKLLRQEPLVPEDGVQAQFQHILEHLEKRNLEQQAEQLLQKSRHGSLSSEEKQRLNALLLALQGQTRPAENAQDSG